MSQFAFLAFQMLGVESFGEAEFWLALVKIIGLIAYFLFSIVYVSTDSQSSIMVPMLTIFQLCIGRYQGR
jgi:amino acid permease